MSPIRGSLAENGFFNSIDGYSMQKNEDGRYLSFGEKQLDGNSSNCELHELPMTRIRYKKKSYKKNNSITYETIDQDVVKTNEFLTDIHNNNTNLLQKVETSKVIYKKKLTRQSSHKNINPVLDIANYNEFVNISSEVSPNNQTPKINEPLNQFNQLNPFYNESHNLSLQKISEENLDAIHIKDINDDSFGNTKKQNEHDNQQSNANIYQKKTIVDDNKNITINSGSYSNFSFARKDNKLFSPNKDEDREDNNYLKGSNSTFSFENYDSTNNNFNNIHKHLFTKFYKIIREAKKINLMDTNQIKALKNYNGNLRYNKLDKKDSKESMSHNISPKFSDPTKEQNKDSSYHDKNKVNDKQINRISSLDNFELTNNKSLKNWDFVQKFNSSNVEQSSIRCDNYNYNYIEQNSNNVERFSFSYDKYDKHNNSNSNSKDKLDDFKDFKVDSVVSIKDSDSLMKDNDSLKRINMDNDIFKEKLNSRNNNNNKFGDDKRNNASKTFEKRFDSDSFLIERLEINISKTNTKINEKNTKSNNTIEIKNEVEISITPELKPKNHKRELSNDFLLCSSAINFEVIKSENIQVQQGQQLEQVTIVKKSQGSQGSQNSQGSHSSHRNQHSVEIKMTSPKLNTNSLNPILSSDLENPINSNQITNPIIEKKDNIDNQFADIDDMCKKPHYTKQNKNIEPIYIDFNSERRNDNNNNNNNNKKEYIVSERSDTLRFNSNMDTQDKQDFIVNYDKEEQKTEEELDFFTQQMIEFKKNKEKEREKELDLIDRSNPKAKKKSMCEKDFENIDNLLNDLSQLTSRKAQNKINSVNQGNKSNNNLNNNINMNNNSNKINSRENKSSKDLPFKSTKLELNTSRDIINMKSNNKFESILHHQNNNQHNNEYFTNRNEQNSNQQLNEDDFDNTNTLEGIEKFTPVENLILEKSYSNKVDKLDTHRKNQQLYGAKLFSQKSITNISGLNKKNSFNTGINSNNSNSAHNSNKQQINIYNKYSAKGSKNETASKLFNRENNDYNSNNSNNINLNNNNINNNNLNNNNYNSNDDKSDDSNYWSNKNNSNNNNFIDKNEKQQFYEKYIKKDKQTANNKVNTENFFGDLEPKDKTEKVGRQKHIKGKSSKVIENIGSIFDNVELMDKSKLFTNNNNTNLITGQTNTNLNSYMNQPSKINNSNKTNKNTDNLISNNTNVEETVTNSNTNRHKRTYSMANPMNIYPTNEIVIIHKKEVEKNFNNYFFK